MCVVLCICSMQGMAMARKEKMEMVLYTHEIRAGANATLLLAAGTGQGNFSELGWGSILTLDNYVKEGPAFTSKTLGRFSGFAVLTTTGGIGDGGKLGVDEFRFGSGSKYNGSSLTVVGTFLEPADGPWEVIIVGGTGYFRGWSGYAISALYLPTTVAPDYAFKWHIYISK